MRKILAAIFICIFFCGICCNADEQQTMPTMIKQILNETKPLKYPRGKRLPLYLWAVTDMVGTDDKQTEEIIRQLDARGIGFVSSWNYDNKQESLNRACKVAAIQKKLGLEVSINASSCMYSFFDGDKRTAHINNNNEPFFDSSFGEAKMGCPFAAEFRYPDITKRFDFFANAYKTKDLQINFIFTDWEVDGPIEWNGAWEASKNCVCCREHIKNIDDFTEYQNALRTIRCKMQKETYADTIKSYFPDVLVGNYGVYPNDGYRYWYDYFEKNVDGAPYKADQLAKYRQWFQEFPLTGYTFAMPVVYTWYPTFKWYDYENPDYRWFYNLLLNATNACKNTPSKTPIISFVHWNTTDPPAAADPNVKQFSEEKYQELLWHMLLRGTDGLYLWCPDNEVAKEVRLLHKVYYDSLEYKNYLDKGKPVCFDVPSKQGPVISGLQLNNKVLVRRTDFDNNAEAVKLMIDGKTIQIPRLEGKCQILNIPK